MPSKYHDIPGFGNFYHLYSWAVSFAEHEDVFVEVGAWLGRSTCFMAEAIQESGKDLLFYAVDTWAGADNEPDQMRIIDSSGGSVYAQFEQNLKAAGVSAFVRPIISDSVLAAKGFAPASCRFIFIDGDHAKECVIADLSAWYPKLKPGAIMAGHDYDQPRVRAAVDDFFNSRAVSVHPVPLPDGGLCWMIEAPGGLLENSPIERESNPPQNNPPQINSSESKPLKLWFSSFRKPGVGDYIHAMSLIPEWQSRNPGQTAFVAYAPYINAEAILGWPGVTYEVSEEPPSGFDDIFYSIHFRQSRYAVFGADWNDKRQHYYVSPAEVAYAQTIWGEARPRICLQWAGGLAEKTYSHLGNVYQHLCRRSKNVAVLDMRCTFDPRKCGSDLARGVVQEKAPGIVVRGRADLRLTLAIAATADLFVGFDSGPMYAALGSRVNASGDQGGVPCVGLFAHEDPEVIFMPITTPEVRLLFSLLDLERIPVLDVLAACDNLLEEGGWNG